MNLGFTLYYVLKIKYFLIYVMFIYDIVGDGDVSIDFSVVAINVNILAKITAGLLWSTLNFNFKLNLFI